MALNFGQSSPFLRLSHLCVAFLPFFSAMSLKDALALWSQSKNSVKVSPNKVFQISVLRTWKVVRLQHGPARPDGPDPL